MTNTTIDELIDRLEAAEFLSYDQFLEVARHFGHYPHDADESCVWPKPAIACALSLLDEAAPWITAWECRSQQRKTRFYAELSALPDDGDELVFCGNARTPQAAILIALLRAVQFKEAAS